MNHEQYPLSCFFRYLLLFYARCSLPMTAFFFSLLILFLPTQFGKHFWPFFSYISGIRIDYLSPTLYFTDILLIFFVASFFLIDFLNQRRNKKEEIRKKKGSYFLYLISNIKLSKPWVLFLALLIFISVGIYNSLNPLAGWYGFLKLLELVLFSFTIRKFLANKGRFVLLHVLCSVGILFESFLAIAQFFHHGSIGGILYFFGERFYSGITPGIANVSVRGQLILRPYGTFSHPNVLAGYLVISMAILVCTFSYIQKNWQKIVSVCALSVGSIGLLVSFSRIAIILWIITLLCVGIFFLLQREFHKEITSILVIFWLLSVFFIIGISLPSLLQHLLTSSFTEEASQERITLIQASLGMVNTHPYLGVGLYNFLDNLPIFIKNQTNMLQPVHNIFLLLFVQLGIIGTTFIIWFVYKTLWHIRNVFKRVKARDRIVPFLGLLCFGIIVNLGQFDHYFLTLQQGQLLTALVLGICWAEFDTINT